MHRRLLPAALAGVIVLLLAAETAQAQVMYSSGRGWGGSGFSVGTPYFSYGQYRGPYGGEWRSYSFGEPYADYGFSTYPARSGFGLGLGLGLPPPPPPPRLGFGFARGFTPLRPFSGPAFSAGYADASPSFTTVTSSSNVVEGPIVQGTTSRAFYAPSENQATVRVTVPVDNAKVWFEDTLTEQKGRTRTFVSPTLESGGTFVYKVKASWTQDGREVTRDKDVRVRPGQEATVSFDDQSRDRLPQPRIDTTGRDRDLPPPPAPGESRRDTPPPAPGSETKKDLPPPPE
jgi:uncharacterized protein (TIGR03000 family)